MKSRFLLGLASVAIVSAVVACSSSTTVIGSSPGTNGGDGGAGAEGGGGGGGGGGMSLADGCATQAAGYCAYLKKCSPIGFAIDFASDADCLSATSASCVFYTNVPDSTRTGDDAAACGAVYSAKSCTDTTQCALSPGKRPTGAACQYAESCATGVCAVAAAGTCGICTDYVAAGAACSVTSPCDYTKGLYCGPSAKCIAFGTVGSACGMTGQASCGTGLTCVKNKCGVGAALGQACGNDTPCDISAAITCDTTAMKCTAINALPAGSACGGSSLSPYCKGGICTANSSGMGSTCVADLGSGASCDPMAKTTGRCGTFLTCTSANTCGYPDDLDCK